MRLASLVQNEFLDLSCLPETILSLGFQALIAATAETFAHIRELNKSCGQALTTSFSNGLDESANSAATFNELVQEHFNSINVIPIFKK
ncbi:unnamed protein product [Protopolystoma xenopodis]|uniref:Uncharacterized protein n=1 Tax=Protopolystoma xenopodis TaxID=117903 RepID=A0A448X8Y4_9PLAT|nr:unnamed protein product [Protopolystoma xenopodis]